jgi:hypothetical protein
MHSRRYDIVSKRRVRPDSSRPPATSAPVLVAPPGCQNAIFGVNAGSSPSSTARNWKAAVRAPVNSRHTMIGPENQPIGPHRNAQNPGQPARPPKSSMPYSHGSRTLLLIISGSQQARTASGCPQPPPPPMRSQREEHNADIHRVPMHERTTSLPAMNPQGA